MTIAAQIMLICCRQGNPRRDADQHAVHREAPASEADLDNTVRTLTEQRLSDTPTNLVRLHIVLDLSWHCHTHAPC